MSFYAKASTATTMTTEAYWTDGSTRTNAVSIASQGNSLTTSWQRFTMPVNFDSSSPNGTNKAIELTNYVVTGGATINITGVQLEIGSVPTSFTRTGGSIQGELAAAQRYYWRNSGVAAYASYGAGYGASSTITEYIIASPVTMRVAPTSVDYASLGASVYGAGPVAISSLSLSAVETTQNSMVVLGTHASGITTGKPYFIANNNNTAGYLGFSAEL